MSVSVVARPGLNPPVSETSGMLGGNIADLRHVGKSDGALALPKLEFGRLLSTDCDSAREHAGSLKGVRPLQDAS
jgi:hypothetical protein